ncbi:polymerase epsilon subunit [Agrobacterium phage Atu_ph04]|uniref:Polymerase epsilon subunit n=1 Tax=Agrobacterium phage Atu_ph04 TaxID=2024263 RepID=A0A223VZT3_9CAUD|nr:polymerase epsilon subunit [Agrobacterium phage Atu_ph04]ASV44675.1 polymerase epsilon subunit [Agrobacterium phage Atu_ph04]
MKNEHGLFEIGTNVPPQGIPIDKIRYLTMMEHEFEPREPEGAEYEATYVDFETTGLDTENDEITSMGYVRFAFDDTSRVTRVVKTGLHLNCPTRDIPEHVTLLTGHTKENLAGHKIEQWHFEDAFRGVEFALAHNAKFDRRYVDRFWKAEPLIWGCTNADLNLREKLMIPSGSLGVLMAYLKNTFFGHHNALDDAWAGFFLADMFLPELISKMFTEEYKVFAWGSDFESKDTLKTRGYKWEVNAPKCWVRDRVPADLIDEEMKWLEQYCHGKQNKVPVDKLQRHI